MSPGAGRLRHRVGQKIQEQELWRPGQRVTVAVSGGMDSVVLLDVLAATAAWHGGALHVATADHGIRAESHEDAALVAELAREHGLPFTAVRLELSADTSEAEARSARRAALCAIPGDVVALAHHQDDQAETVLLQLLRGTGSAGLAGMRWKRGRFVRPLLGEPRSALRAYADDRHLRWKDDPSNDDPRYLRNRIRHEVLPLLEALRPGAGAALARASRAVAEDTDLLAACVAFTPEAAGPPWDAAWVANAPAALVRRAILLAFPELTTAQLDDVVAAARRGSGTIELGSRRSLRVGAGLLCLQPPLTGPPSGRC
jgi:tRNA(Ile)-lysidine synthetase-like protein